MQRYNDNHHGKSYRYVWGVGSPDHTPTHVTGLVKVDLGESSLGANGDDRAGPIAAPTISWYKQSHYPSEPIFIPRPGATEEDDGVVLTVMLDGAARASYLLVLNASTMETIATAYSPVVMPA